MRCEYAATTDRDDDRVEDLPPLLIAVRSAVVNGRRVERGVTWISAELAVANSHPHLWGRPTAEQYWGRFKGPGGRVMLERAGIAQPTVTRARDTSRSDPPRPAWRLPDPRPAWRLPESNGR